MELSIKGTRGKLEEERINVLFLLSFSRERESGITNAYNFSCSPFFFFSFFFPPFVLAETTGIKCMRKWNKRGKGFSMISQDSVDNGGV